MRPTIILLALLLLIPAPAAAVCITYPPEVKTFGPVMDPRERINLFAGSDARVFEIRYWRDGERVTRYKALGPGCVFRTGWWRMDSGRLLKVLVDGELIHKERITGTKVVKRLYRGFERGLWCPYELAGGAQ